MANEVKFKVLGDVKDLETKLGKVKTSLSNLGRNSAIAFGGLSASIFGFSQAALKQEKAVTKVDQAIKSTGKAAGFTLQQLENQAKRLQEETLFGDEVVLESATAQLLTFTNISKDNFLRVQQAALDVSTVLDDTGDGSARLKDVSLQLGKALNDPVSNLGALSRAGIQFSDEQTEMIKSLAQTNRLSEAQTIILDELNNQYGGQAKAAAKGYRGQLNALKDVSGDLSKIMGFSLLPAITDITKSFTGFLKIAANHPGLVKVTAKFLLFGTAIAGSLAAIGFLGSGVISAFGIFGKLVVLFKGLTAVVASFNITMLANPVVLVVGAIVAAVGILFVAWKNNFGGIQQLTESLFQKLVEFKNNVVEIWGKVTDTISKSTEAITNSISKVGNFLGFAKTAEATEVSEENSVVDENTVAVKKATNNALLQEQERHHEALLELQKSLKEQQMELENQEKDTIRNLKLQQDEEELILEKIKLERFLQDLDAKKLMLQEHGALTIDIEKQIADQTLKIKKAQAKNEKKILQDRLKSNELFRARDVQNIDTTLNQVGSLNKSAARVIQKIMLGRSIINVASGVTRALAEANFIKAAIIAAQGGIEIATIAAQSFAVGTPEVPHDMLANVHRGETIIPENFASAIRSGELTLSGRGETHSSNVTHFDFSGSEFNGINEDLVQDIFHKAGEMIQNQTLEPVGGA